MKKTIYLIVTLKLEMPIFRTLGFLKAFGKVTKYFLHSNSFEKISF